MSTSDLAIIAAIFLTLCALTNLAILAIWLSLRKEVRGMRAELVTEIRAIGAGVRVSDVELENARMQGVMSVIQAQAHSHDDGGAAGRGASRISPTSDDDD